MRLYVVASHTIRMPNERKRQPEPQATALSSSRKCLIQVLRSAQPVQEKAARSSTSAISGIIAGPAGIMFAVVRSV
jgi:hypothetical protein